MRILFSTRGSAGHVLPLAPFAHAAVRAGHEVLVAAQAGNADVVARTGLPFAPFDDPDPRASGALMARLGDLDLDAANALMIGEHFARIDTVAALPGLDELVGEWRPDVVVRETMEFGAALVAERHDRPVARVGLGLGAVEELAIALAAPAVDALRAEHDLPADPDGARLREAPLLTMVPAALDTPGGEDGDVVPRRFRAPVAALDAAASAPLPAWWGTGLRAAPLVYVSLGSVAGSPHMTYFPTVYRTLLEALSSLPVRVLMTLGQGADPNALGPLPPNVHVERWVPQDAILPHADAAVLHGGYGSTLGALAHGVPQVVLPLFSIDQWANAEAVQRVGAGLALDDDRDARGVLDAPAEATLARLAGAVRRVLDDGGYRRRAAAVAAAMAELPPVEAALGELVSPAGRRPWRPAAAW